MSRMVYGLLAGCLLAGLGRPGLALASDAPGVPAAAPTSAPVPGPAQPPATTPSLALAPAPWLLEWDARWRDEQVDDAAFRRAAHADTLRLRVGIRANLCGGWSGLLAAAGTASTVDRYNSGANGHSQYPAVTDPTGSELDQAWLTWRGSAFGATLGRQNLQLDNQRWVGNSAWRQYQQTFDALATTWQPNASLNVQYDWLNRVHRVAGPDALNRQARERRLDTHLLNVAWTAGTQRWAGYAYLHDDKDVATASTATYGLRWTGSALRDGSGPGWSVEVARQRQYADNPQHFAHAYWLLEPTWTQAGVTARAGWEHLGGNGRHALQTPLATLHAFNGWDDQFNVTPAGGLEDRYLGINGAFARAGLPGKPLWALTWHDYRADHGGRYGTEWDAALTVTLLPGLAGMIKYADYQARGFGHDSRKLWLQLEWHGQQPLAGVR